MIQPGIHTDWSTHPPVEFRNGLPFSTLRDDFFWNRQDVFEASSAVYLNGCGLAHSWSRPLHRPFVLLELGFGLGVNFTNVRALWQRCGLPGRLIYVAVEKHPLMRRDMIAAWAALQGDVLSHRQSVDDLLAQWPEPSGGYSRLQFDDRSLTLLLITADARRALRSMKLLADAVFLDIPSPPDPEGSWQAPLLKALARRCKPMARLTTGRSEPALRKHLAEAGFVLGSEQVLAGRQQHIEAVFDPPWATTVRFSDKTVSTSSAAYSNNAMPTRNVLVIGAGLAGCATTRELLRRGWQVTLFDAPGRRLTGSNQPVVIEHLHVSPDHNRLAQLTRSAWQLARSGGWFAAAKGDPGAAVRRIGKLMLLDDEPTWRQWQAAIDQLRLPATYVRLLDAAQARQLAGWAPLQAHRRLQGAIYFQDVVAADPQQLCRQWLDEGLADSAEGSLQIIRQPVTRLEATAEGWRAQCAAGAFSASVAVVCAAGASSQLVPLASLATQDSAGQATELAANVPPPLLALGGAAYICPRADSIVVGATFAPVPGFDASDAGDLSNLARLARSLGVVANDERALIEWCDSQGLTVRARHPGIRSAARDRMPIIGCWPDEAQALTLRARLPADDRQRTPVLPSLYANHGYGARGLLWSVLGAEMIGAQLDAEPLPVSPELADAVDPSRGMRRWLRSQS